MINQVTSENLVIFGKKLLNSTGFEEGIPLIASFACEIIHADRCSIFVYDKETNELWTTLADGTERIIINATQGIVGRSIKTKQCIIENDVSKNQYFLEDIDKKSGFTTESIIVTPIFDESQKVLGALELLNKENGFNKDDEKFMIFFANFISSFIDLAPR